MSDERRISDEAVKAKTGKTWKQWLAILDRWDAAGKGHAATAKHLHEEHGVDGWWAQTITVRHEKERGLRETHQRGKTYASSVSRTIAAKPEAIWEAWTTARGLNRWFTTKARVNPKVGGRYSNADRDTGEYRVVRPPRVLRFTWENEKACPGTVVELRIDPAKTRGKSRAVVRHMRLCSPEDVARMKEGWSWAMDSLKSWLETGSPVTWEAWREAKGLPPE
jgi:uncharacterized protein YndB with AHSA1/START domain